MLQVLIAITPLFLVIFTTAFFQKLSKADNNWEKVLNDFALNVGLPALIFLALAKTEFSLAGELDIILANSALIVGSFILVYIIGKLFKLKPRTIRTLFIAMAFSNTAYLGIPVLTQISGEAVLPKVSLIIAIYIFWIFTIGIGYLEYHQNNKKRNLVKKIASELITNPLLIAVFAGILISIIQIQIPDIIAKSLSMVAASVTPVVLVVIGLFIGKSEIGKLKEWIPVLILSLITLFAIPAIFLYGIKLAGLNPANFSISIIEAAMPMAITPFALADEYKLQKKLLARTIVLSTILSTITIPFWTAIV